MPKIVLRNWGRFAAAMNAGQLRKRLRKNIKRANLRSAHFVERAMRKEIRSGKFTPNADLTIAIKGEDNPLIDFGFLRKAVTHKLLGWAKVFIGVLQTDGFYNIAVTLHDGYEIPVSDAMRGLFFVLWLASKAREEGTDGPQLNGRAAELFDRHKIWFPLADDTRIIRLPKRPFAEQAMASRALRDKVLKEWQQAAQNALAGR